MIKLIVFDWDDVFTHGAKEGYLACYKETLKSLDVLLQEDEIKKIIKAKWGSTLTEVFAELLQEKPQLINMAIEKFNEMMMGDVFVDHLSLVEGSSDLIKKLSKDYKLAIASGINPQVLMEKIFTRFNIPNLFSEIITVYDLENPEHAKPHPFMVEEIVKRLNIKAEEAVVVGDSWSDVQMAQNAGVIPIVVLTGQLIREQAEEMGVKYILEDVTKIEEVLNQLNQSAS